MGRRLSGRDMETMVGDFMVRIEEATLDIEDGSASTKTGGRPNGYIRGNVSASGEITLDIANFNVLVEAAKKSGSFQELEPFDIVMNGETTSEKLKVEAFECLVKVSSLVNASANGEEKLTVKLPYEVTGKDFVRINGVPYAPESDIENLL